MAALNGVLIPFGILNQDDQQRASRIADSNNSDLGLPVNGKESKLLAEIHR